MARSLLLDKPGTPIPQFNVSRAQFQALRPAAADIAHPVGAWFHVLDRIRANTLPATALRLLSRVRKNQRDMTSDQWNAFLDAIDEIAKPGAAPPRYADFVNLHDRAMTTNTGMSWGAHTMQAM